MWRPGAAIAKVAVILAADMKQRQRCPWISDRESGPLAMAGPGWNADAAGLFALVQ